MEVGIETAEGEGEEEGSGLLLTLQSRILSWIQRWPPRNWLLQQSWLRRAGGCRGAPLGCRDLSRYGDEF